MPSIDDVLKNLLGPSCFLMVDLRYDYLQFIVSDSDILKITFRTRYDHYSLEVIFYGLANTIWFRWT